MSDDYRPIPPGKGRLAAALKAGLLTRSEMTVAGVVLVAAALAMLVTSERLAHGLKDLFSSSVEVIAGRPDPATALKDSMLRGLSLVAPILVTSAVAGGAAIVIPSIWARRKGARTAVPLPPSPKMRLTSFLLKVVVIAAITLISMLILRNHTDALALSMTGDQEAASKLFGAMVGLLASAGAAMILIGVSEQSLKRHLLWKSLHLTDSEARMERRMDGGEKRTRKRRPERASDEDGQ